MERYITLILKVRNDFTEEDLNKNFEQLELDSIDLIRLRVEFENLWGQVIPNGDWLQFRTVSDIISYKESTNSIITPAVNPTSKSFDNRVSYFNMPQMALESLSENWLFKESGAMHWEMLCNGLNTPSSALTDELGNRLYATFVRIKMESSALLSVYKENDPYRMEGHIKRFGSGMYFSRTNLKSRGNEINVQMMTSFSVRKDTGNKSLVKSQPFTETNEIAAYPEMPEFGEVYRNLKKGEIENFNGFNIQGDTLYTTYYTLNPYYDLNGVGLLYFAAYPVISDYCEAQYFNQNSKERWELNWFTKSRDVMYYANCDINDRVKYQLHHFITSDSEIKLFSSLVREADGEVMARIFTVKGRTA